MYPDFLKNEVEKVHSTRQLRMTQKPISFTDDEKKSLLSDYHPDYKKGVHRFLRIGANKGEKVLNEFADMLEAYSWIDDDEFDLSRIDYEVDVLVIGGGGAGVAAALAADEMGANVLLATKLRIGDANTVMAQGGIQAADKLPDTPAQHYLDIIGGGHYCNIPELVKTLVFDAPYIIQWLEDLGVMFDKEPDGTMITIHGGGTSRKRMHSAKDYTGAEIMKTLRDEFLNRRISYLEYSPAIELLTTDKRCTGAVLCNLETHEYIVVRSKTTIIATGGTGRLHVQNFPTTNHYGATGDGIVLCYRAGCKLIFMDTIQYHPTGTAYPEQIIGLLITEKCRGLGAHLVNSDGDRFVNELDPRDIVTAAIIRECARGKGIRTPSGIQGVWLDTPLIDIINGEGTVQKALPAMYRQYKRFGIDISKEPILVYPTQHYQNGGVLINTNCETNIENLYVAGECAGGVHGRNRLMGNSLLDVLVFGRRAGRAAAKKAKEISFDKVNFQHLKEYHSALKKLNIVRTVKSPLLLPDYRRTYVKTKLVKLFD